MALADWLNNLQITESNILFFLVVLLLLMAIAPRFMLLNVSTYLPKESVWVKKVTKQFLVVCLISILISYGILFGATYLGIGRIPLITILGLFGLASARVLWHQQPPLIHPKDNLSFNSEIAEKALEEIEYILDYEQRKWLKNKEYDKLGKSLLKSGKKYKVGSLFLSLGMFIVGVVALHIMYDPSDLFSGFHPAGVFAILLGPLILAFQRHQSAEFKKMSKFLIEVADAEQ